MSATEPNRWEIEGRADKAWRLARALRALGVDHETAAAYTEEQWEVAAAVAGTNPPHEKCQGLVIGLLTPNQKLRRAEP